MQASSLATCHGRGPSHSNITLCMPVAPLAQKFNYRPITSSQCFLLVRSLREPLYRRRHTALSSQRAHAWYKVQNGTIALNQPRLFSAAPSRFQFRRAFSMNAVDSQFFTAYADVNVHQIMLKDQARNEAYWAALQAHARGKVVLDVGSGTGFLSILAARAGAAHVYAVEASDMAEVSKDIIDDNMLSDCITVITGRIEDVSLPCMVDIIVSEWMGFYLVHESMMRSVLIARDRFLKPDGIMLPESADIYCAPANCDGDVQSNISWCNLYSYICTIQHFMLQFAFMYMCNPTFHYASCTHAF